MMMVLMIDDCLMIDVMMTRIIRVVMVLWITEITHPRYQQENEI
jgi:hypothetical protein